MANVLSITMILFGLIGLSPSSARADMLFGPDESIHRITEVEIDGETYYLAFKTTMYFFVAGVYVSDDGYVLQEKGKTNWFIPLSQDEIRDLQAAGHLPDPLPRYTVPIWEYLFGYSLWIVVAGTAAFSALGAKLSPRRRSHHVRRLMADPTYREALGLALDSDNGGINQAVDFLQSRNVPLEEAQRNMQVLLQQGERISI
jgi:hypothetical protein